ncbi:MAG: hypothetical protein E7545_04615 [Ruminococcaceae bacterium]|nr:hypothetical protein [Oscillospiraceae bacterium]
MQNFYKTDYTVKSTEIDSNWKMRIDRIVELFQSITGIHSTQMGVDGPTLLKNSNAFWVLTKFKIKIDTLPLMEETVLVETWPTFVKGVRFGRDFLMQKDGKTYVMGSSEWCTLDYTTKELRRANSVCYPADMTHRDYLSGAGDFIRVRETVNESDYNHAHRCAFVDIDTNKHTNNIAYLRMALNCFSPDEFEALNVSDMQITFVSQSYYGDEIKVYKKQIETGFYIEGKLNDKSVFNCVVTLK